MARDLPINYVRIGSLSVAKALHEFIQQAAAPGTSISAEAFWSGFAELLRECGTRNRQLLQVRDELQSRIDQYHRERSGEPLDLGDYERFLRDIGYAGSSVLPRHVGWPHGTIGRTQSGGGVCSLVAVAAGLALCIVPPLGRPKK